MSETEVFNPEYSRYYNLLYADKDYAAETDYIANLLKKYAPFAKDILEYGSGTGIHGIALNKKGYSVYGIERSEAMAKEARLNGLACEVGDITTLELQKKFDAVLSLFHVISYINDNEKLVKLFSDTRARLKNGGVFIFDVWFTPAVMNQMPEKREKKMEDAESLVIRSAVPTIDYLKNVVDVNYHIVVKNKADNSTHEFDERHPMRHFSVPEIALLASQTGFTLISAEEFLTGNEPSVSTWGVTFILKNS